MNRNSNVGLPPKTPTAFADLRTLVGGSRSRSLHRTAAAAVVASVLMFGGCTVSDDPALPAPTQPTVPDAGATERPPIGKGEALPGDASSWTQIEAGDLVVPAPMRDLARDSFGQVRTAVYNAGKDVRPSQVAQWLQEQNTDVAWTMNQVPSGVQLLGEDHSRAGTVTFDITTTDAGVLLRMVDPGPAGQVASPSPTSATDPSDVLPEEPTAGP